MKKEDAVQLILFILQYVAEGDRVHVLNEVGSEYCIYCGSTDGYSCYCRCDD